MSDSNEVTMYKAFRAAQMEMDDAAKSATNPHFKSDYADLKAVKEACFEAFHKHGFAVSQFPEFDPTIGVVTVETRLMHDCGQYISGRLSIPVGKTDAQAIGSAITYARRYALASMAGVAPKDDDGNEASKPAPEPRESQADEYKRLIAEVTKLMGECAKHSGKLRDELKAECGIVPGTNPTLSMLREAKPILMAILSQPDADEIESIQQNLGETPI